MDYNQSNGQNKIPDFFTAGAGTNNSEVNNFEAENNLDLSNKQIEWQNTIPNNMQNIGNRVTNITKEQNPINGSLETPQLGQNIELESPKNPDPAQISTATISRTPYDIQLVHVKNGKISEEGAKAIIHIEDELGKTHDPARFYDEAGVIKGNAMQNTFPDQVDMGKIYGGLAA